MWIQLKIEIHSGVSARRSGGMESMLFFCLNEFRMLLLTDAKLVYADGVCAPV